MAFVPTTQNVKPVVGGSADVWGGILNDRIGEIYADFVALAAQYNVTQTVALAALARAGGTMTGDLVLANVGPTSQYSSGFKGLPVVSITADRTFLLTDAAKMIRLTGGTPRTWTIPPNGSVAFPIGTVIVLRNASTATLTLTRGSGVDLRVDGSTANANRSISPQGRVSMVQEAANEWVIGGVGLS